MENRNIINGILMCPVCGGALSLTADGRSAACTGGAKRHLFDFASGGYINLYTSRAAGGDSAECFPFQRLLRKNFGCGKRSYRKIRRRGRACVGRGLRRGLLHEQNGGGGEHRIRI